MVILDPDFPHIVWAFSYRGWRLEIDQSDLNGYPHYSVWASHANGCAVAVPCAFSREDAIRQGKRYVDQRLQAS